MFKRLPGNLQSWKDVREKFRVEESQPFDLLLQMREATEPR